MHDRPVSILDRATPELVPGVVRPARLADKMLWSRWHGWTSAEAEDAHWEWDAFIDVGVALPDEYPVFSLEAAGELQGLIFLETAGPQVSSLGFHVSRLSTAPWNRPPGSRLRGTGSVLLGDAVLRSRAAGYGGRIYLSSLPGAERFYRRIGMTQLPDRDAENLSQFTFDPVGAGAFVQSLEQDGFIDAGP